MTPGDYEPSGFFALRTPLLPFDEVTRWGTGLEAPAHRDDPAGLDEAVASDRLLLRRRLDDIVASPRFRDAVFVASPSLAAAIDGWRKDPDGDRGRRAEVSLVCYFMRAAARCTPFGLFAGCTTGTIKSDTRMRLRGQQHYRRHTRLDMDYLWALGEAVERDAELRSDLTYRPNSSLHSVADRLLFAEHRGNDTGRSYHLVAVDKTPHLTRTLDLARCGAGLDVLARALTSDDISESEAKEYLADLVESQVLVSDARPQLTGPPTADALADALAGHASTADLAHLHDAVRAGLGAIDAEGIGTPTERYLAAAGILDDSPAKPQLGRFVQVDLTKPARTATLGMDVVTEVRRGIDILHALARPVGEEALRRFREQFTRRYDTRCVPLAEVLDEETGIGFGKLADAQAAPLLAGLPMRRQRDGGGDRLVTWTSRDGFVLGKLTEALNIGQQEITIEPSEVASLRAPDAAPMPDAFEVLASISARSPQAIGHGDFLVVIGSASGPSGARLLGRFCHADDELHASVREHLRAEEALRPDCVFAEIVHQPEGRLGNILSRPVLRAYEIGYLGHSGAPADRQLQLSDLLVTVSDGRIVLRSARLGREVIPRLTTAHNHVVGGLGTYRFLCALQYQGVAQGIKWDWGPLRDAPFLPRVRCGRAVLSRASWNLRDADLAAFKPPRASERFAAVQRLRDRLRLPRFVALADADNELLADLDNVLSIEALAHQLRRRAFATLVELMPGPGQLWVSGPEGRFTHEVVVPFVRRPPEPAGPDGRGPRDHARPEVAPSARRDPGPSAHLSARADPGPHPIPRSFPPGSEWLYLKLFTGQATADQVLRLAAPVLADCVTSALADQWHFLRYGDPDWHLRLRLHGAPDSLLGEVLPRLRRLAAPLLDTGQLWRIQVDTYEREVERYGGPRGIELAERIFHADSEASLAIVCLLPGAVGADLRWQVALRGIDLLFDDLGLTLAQKLAIARRARRGYEQEFGGADGAFQRAVGRRYREQRPRLESLLGRADLVPDELAPSIEILRQRSAAVSRAGSELRALADAGQLRADLPELAVSFAHMHVNRLLRSAQRAQELVSYEMLDRHYSSRSARLEIAESSQQTSPSAIGDQGGEGR